MRGAFLSGDDEAIARDLSLLPAEGRVWLVFSHEWWGYGDIERVRMTDALAQRTTSGAPAAAVERPGAEAFLFELRAP